MCDPVYMCNLRSSMLKRRFPYSTYANLPAVLSSSAYLEMSSATKDVATLRRGILNTFDIMLKIDTEMPADANSNAPLIKAKSFSGVNWRSLFPLKHLFKEKVER